MPLCYPANTDWSCEYTADQLAEMREDPAQLARMERAEALAWYSLAALCAYRIGVCPITVRPCSVGCLNSSVTYMDAIASGGRHGALPTATIGKSFTPMITGGNWVNSCGCLAGDDCSCSALDEVYLPGPVGEIVEVRIDGEVVPADQYRVDNGNRLVSMGPAWPTCQDLSKPGGAEGTFEVTYYRGAAPNEITRMAAGVLAVEFYRACAGDKKCRLPRGVTSVARNGVSYEVDAGLFSDGYTKIPEVDAVIRIFNPNRLMGAPRVLSPDGRRSPRRQTGGYRNA